MPQHRVPILRSLEDVRLELSVDPLADALAWRKCDPEAYRALVLWAKGDVANGVRPSMDAYGRLLRRPPQPLLADVLQETVLDHVRKDAA